MAEWRDVARLAFRDYSHEWHISGCFILGLAAVLAPLLVLFGLKYGLVTSMLTALAENPENRELKPLGSGHYTAVWFRGMRARPEVAFVSPRTRTLAATLELSSKTAPVILPAELIPSGQHDPLLKGLERRPAGLHEVVLSRSAAERLKVTKGAVIQASLSRQYQARHERVRLDLQIVDVASERAFARPAVFASLEVLMAAEAFRDGRAVPALGWSGDPPLAEERVFPSFRLYARTIYDVAGLASVLTEAGQRVKTSAAEIETVRSIDRNLALLFWVIAAAGMAGYSLSLGASLWANTDRKRRELSVLRLLGFRGGGIMLYPSFHALFTAVLGWLGAVFVYLVLEQIINRMLAADLAPGQSICFLMPRHFLAALFLTLIASLLGAVLGGIRAARIEPSDGLREV